MDPRLAARLAAAARLLDSQWRIPGTKIRFGLDPILGLVPGAGDAVSLAISAWIVAEARRHGVPRRVLARMISNVLLDLATGVIPVVGDLVDVAVKANIRNLRLMGLDPDAPPPPTATGRPPGPPGAPSAPR